MDKIPVKDQKVSQRGKDPVFVTILINGLDIHDGSCCVTYTTSTQSTFHSWKKFCAAMRLSGTPDYHVFVPFNPNDHCFHFLHTDMHSPLDSIPHIFGRMHAPAHRRTCFQHICTHTRSHAPSIPQQTFCCLLCLSLLVVISLCFLLYVEVTVFT